MKTTAKTTTDYKQPIVEFEANKVFATYTIDNKEVKAMYFIQGNENITKVQDFIKAKAGFEGYVISQLKDAGILKNLSDSKDDIQNEMLSLFA